MEEEEAEENDREISLEILIEEAIRDFFVCSVSHTLFTRVQNVIGSYFIDEKHCNLQHNVISVPNPNKS